MFRIYKQKLSHFSHNAKFLIYSELLSATGMTFWGLLFNLYLKSLGFSREEIGNTLLCGNLAIACCALPMAFLSNKHRFHRLMGVGQILSLLFLLLSLVFTGKWEIRFFVFMAFSFMTASKILISPFIMENSSIVERTYVFSLHSIAGYVGGVLGNLLAGTSADGAAKFLGLVSSDSYRVAILVGLSLSFFGALSLLSFVKTPKKKEQSYNVSFNYFKGLDWNYFTKVLLPANLIALGAGLIVQFLNLYLKDVFHASDSFIGVVMSIQSAAIMAATFVAPLIAERLGKVKAVTLFYSLSLPFMVILAFTTEIFWGSAGVVVRAALMNMAGPLFSSIVYEYCVPGNRSFLNALNTIFWALSWALSAFLYGTVFKGDYTLCFLLASALYLASTILFYRFFKDRENRDFAKTV